MLEKTWERETCEEWLEEIAKKKMKSNFKKMFKEIYPKGARLLAVQLDGFTHSVIYDGGKRSTPIIRDSFSHCMPEGNWSKRAMEFFKGIGNAGYQNNPQEFIYILPENR